MNVVRLSVASRRKPQDERIGRQIAVLAKALAHLESVVAIYREPGARPNPATILTMVAAILDEPELRAAAGLDAAKECRIEPALQPMIEPMNEPMIDPMPPGAEGPAAGLKNAG